MAKVYMIVRIVLFLFSLIGLALYIAAFAIPKWSKHTDGNDGLWQTCYMNGGEDTCARWHGDLQSDQLLAIQAIACVGLAFYILFVIAAALTIFWTSHWKKAKAIKYSTVVFAILAVIFLAVCIVLYKNDLDSQPTKSLDISWLLSIISAAFAGIAMPFYLVDACRTVPPPKPDRENLFQKINNIPPIPAPTSYPSKEFNSFDSDIGEPTTKPKNGTRPPLLSELRRQNTTFVHPPPLKNAKNKMLFEKDIKKFPLPPTKTKLNLFEKDEIENHPSPVVLAPVDPKPENGKKGMRSSRSSSSITTTSILEDVEPQDENPNSVFKFHKTKTIQKGNKTLLKIQNEKQNLPPVMMVMGGVEDSDDEEVKQARVQKNDLMRQWEEEQARRKFAPYFIEALSSSPRSELSPSGKLQEKMKQKIESMKGQQSESTKQKIGQMNAIYDERSSKPKKKLAKTQSKLSLNKSPNGKANDTNSVQSLQTGVTISNIEETNA